MLLTPLSSLLGIVPGKNILLSDSFAIFSWTFILSIIISTPNHLGAESLGGGTKERKKGDMLVSVS
jgi:hypothetical protein